MHRHAAVRTGERMTLSVSAQPAPRAVLTRVGGVDKRDSDTRHLGLRLDGGTDGAKLPERQTATQRQTSGKSLLRPLHLQVLKHEHGIDGSPLYKALGRDAGEADLLCDHKGRWRLKVCAHFPDPAQQTTTDVLGVDLGIVSIATDSDGMRYSGAKLLGLRARYTHMRTKLQKKGTSSARKLRRKRSKKERRFQADTNHVISKKIVQQAASTGRALAVEDLTHLRTRVRLKKSQRRTHSSWAYADLRAKIAYKATMDGLSLFVVDPAYTSQTCSQCGHCEKANRPTQAFFLCRQCGFAAHADGNAAQNIRALGRVAVMLPNIPRSGVLNRVGTSPLL